MLEKDIVDTQQRYRKRWLEFGYDPRSLGWNKNCQWVRFEAIFEGLGPEEFETILDVGCGFGDLLSYLRLRGWKGHYAGIDLLPEFVEQATKIHAEDPAAEFVCTDVAQYAPARSHDLAVAIGAFNHQVSGGNLAFIGETFKNMWALSSKAVVCDFLSTSSDPEKRMPNLYYADPAELFALAARYTRRVMIHHAYMPFEFQIKAWHDERFSIAEPVFPPYEPVAKEQSEWQRARS